MATFYNSTHFQSMPWKNGGGSTLELIRILDPNEPNSFLLRLSIAHVQIDGPFSLFPGIDRWLMLIQGHGFKLHFDNGEKVKLSKPFSPIFFEGEKSINCELIEGSCFDFNVMVKREWASVNVKCTFRHKNELYQKEGASETYVYLAQKNPILIHLKAQESFDDLVMEDCWMIEIEIQPKRE